jgi:hypothetical protein
MRLSPHWRIEDRCASYRTWMRRHLLDILSREIGIKRTSEHLRHGQVERGSEPFNGFNLVIGRRE